MRPPPSGFRPHAARFAVPSAVAIAGFAALSAPAVERVATNAYELLPGDLTGEELWLRAETARFAGTTTEDIYVLAKTIDLGGSFEDSVWCLGTESVDLGGEMGQQVRIGGRDLEISGTLEHSLIAAGATVTLAGTAHVKDTAVLFGDTVTTDGRFDGDLIVFANRATVHGQIAGTLHIYAGDIVIQPGTTIEGDIVYASPQELTPGSKVSVGGDITETSLPGISLSPAGALLLRTAVFGGCLLLALPYIRWMPKATAFGMAAVARTPGRSLLIGVFTIWILPAFGLLCLRFVYTLPIGLILLSVVFVLAYLAMVIVSLTVGGILLKRIRGAVPPRAVPAFLLGLLVLYIGTFVPILSIVIWGFTVTAGIGGVALGLWASQRDTALPMAAGDEPPEEGGPPPAHDVSKSIKE